MGVTGVRRKNKKKMMQPPGSQAKSPIRYRNRAWSPELFGNASRPKCRSGMGNDKMIRIRVISSSLSYARYLSFFFSTAATNTGRSCFYRASVLVEGVVSQGGNAWKQGLGSARCDP